MADIKRYTIEKPVVLSVILKNKPVFIEIKPGVGLIKTNQKNNTVWFVDKNDKEFRVTNDLDYIQRLYEEECVCLTFLTFNLKIENSYNVKVSNEMLNDLRSFKRHYYTTSDGNN